MTKKDFQKFLSPVRKPPQVHGSARPVGFSERSFYNSDKRYFTGIRKELICKKSTEDITDANYDKIRKFSDEISPTNNQYPKAQFYCPSGEDDENLQDANDEANIRYYIEYAKTSDEGSGVNVQIPVTVYDNKQYCSSWATAVTSAMTLTLSRWNHDTVNLSIQFLLDCDILGDPCVERPPLSAYEQFWRRYVPPTENWRKSEDPLSAPSKQLTQGMCDNYRACYPGMSSCKRTLVMTGVCEPGSQEYGSCPIYFLYNWRWIKSHLAEVGAVTSSIIARAALFTYSEGVYSSWHSDKTASSYQSAWDVEVVDTPDLSNANDYRGSILGMLDVTIIGWGQMRANLTDDDSNSKMKQRWWYVIPHLGLDFGLTCSTLMAVIPQNAVSGDVVDAYTTENTESKVKAVSFKNPNKVIDDTTTPPTIATLGGFTFLLGKEKIGSTTKEYTCTMLGDGANLPQVDPENPITNDGRTGIIMFNRRFDDSNIESQAVGAVPYNFVPQPWRTPSQTWLGYTTPPT